MFYYFSFSRNFLTFIAYQAQFYGVDRDLSTFRFGAVFSFLCLFCASNLSSNLQLKGLAQFPDFTACYAQFYKVDHVLFTFLFLAQLSNIVTYSAQFYHVDHDLFTFVSAQISDLEPLFALNPNISHSHALQPSLNVYQMYSAPYPVFSAKKTLPCAGPG